MRQRQSAEKQKLRCFRETLAGWKSAANHFVARGPKSFPRARHETTGGNSRGVLEKHVLNWKLIDLHVHEGGLLSSVLIILHQKRRLRTLLIHLVDLIA